MNELLMPGMELGQVMGRGLCERAGLSLDRFDVLRDVAATARASRTPSTPSARSG